nr:DUF5335 domain-containing protein [uncultured Duganella sp.]
MTTTTKLERNTWKPYFDNVSKLLDGKQVEIEVMALGIGSQVEAEWLPALGVTYDARGDLLAVMAEGMDHMIRHPRAVYAETEGVNLHSIDVIDDDGASHVIRFREALLLPAR